MRWMQIRRKCYVCGMPLTDFNMPLGPHTVAGADAVAGGGEGDDDQRSHGQLVVKPHIRSSSYSTTYVASICISIIFVENT